MARRLLDRLGVWRLVFLVGIVGMARADDWQSAPRPNEASGIERDEATPVGEHLLWVPRVVLFVPRVVVWTVGQPVRGAAYAYSHYDLEAKWRRWFFTEDERFGVYPVATYETGFGISGGARVIHRDLLGAGERLKLRADYATTYRQHYSVRVHSGRRISRVGLELDTRYERRPDEPFYGIGDDATGIEMRLREDLVRSYVAADVEVVEPLHARIAGAVTVRELAGMRADTARGELQLVLDTRRPASAFASNVVDGTGWRASLFTGIARGIDGDSTRYTSYGGELQRFFDLYRGTRVLALRVLVEAIDGEAPFVELPQLGGAEFLRGYPRGRFRDHALTLATAEYTWDLGNYFVAYTFVDAGRVWSSLREVALVDPRIGYGLGLQLHTKDRRFGRVQVAASRDGDVVVELVLTPGFPRRERLGRY